VSTGQRVVAVIPTRLASTRFPEKALAAETGMTMTQHVHDQVMRATSIDHVIVATDHQRIVDAVRGFGGDARLTSGDHPNGTSRIAEVARDLEADLIVNVQGDEPEIEPSIIDTAVEALHSDDAAPMGTIASPFRDDEDPNDPNIVKVVRDQRGRALYFSRSRIPFDRDGAGVAVYKHVGLYVYRRSFLPTYVALPEAPLERAERLEQLRVLEHGYPIVVAIGDARHHGIDTPEQYAAFVERCRAHGP